MNVSLLAVSTRGEAYVRIAGRRDRAISSLDGFFAELDRWERRDKSNMKFPAARLEGVRGNSSLMVTSYGWRVANSVPKGAVPQGGPSLLTRAEIRHQRTRPGHIIEVSGGLSSVSCFQRTQIADAPGVAVQPAE